MNTEIDRINQLKYARKEGREEGMKEGMEKGREEGREEGRKEGHEAGREEGFRLMAELLRKRGVSEEEIERTLEEARAL